MSSGSKWIFRMYSTNGIQAGHNAKAALRRRFPEEEVEHRCLVGLTLRQITADHGDLVEVGQKRVIYITHALKNKGKLMLARRIGVLERETGLEPATFTLAT